MAELDNDLLSIQEARTLATQARDAQRKFLHATQAEVDRICAAMAQAAADAAVTLGRMANEETGYGSPSARRPRTALPSPPTGSWCGGASGGTTSPWRARRC